MKGLFSVLFVVCGLFAQAQFSDSVTHYVRLSAAGNLNRSNNSTAYLLNNDVRYSVKNKRTTVNAVASWLYGEQDNQVTNNDFNATGDFNLYHDSSNLYYWALANYATSYSLKINSQLQTGLGAAYNFVNTSASWLNVSEGILYETSHLNTGDPVIDQYHTFRNSLRVSYKFVIKNAITLSGTNFLQQAFANKSDYIIRTDNSLGIKLNKWIALTTNVVYNRFKRTGTDNLLFTYGLVAEKYF